MTDPTLQKLVLQLLPAVASIPRNRPAGTPEQVKEMWSELLDEAKSVAFLYEAKFLTPTAPTETLPKPA